MGPSSSSSSSPPATPTPSPPPPFPPSSAHHHHHHAGGSFARPRRLPQEAGGESFFPLLTDEHADDDSSSSGGGVNRHHSPTASHRDSLYTSMPVLTDLPDGGEGEDPDLHPHHHHHHHHPHHAPGGEPAQQPCKSATAPELDDVYYKSMPNLGSRNHLHQLHTYYQMGRGGSDGYMVPPPGKEDSDSSPEEPPVDPAHLVTSL